MKIDFKDNNLIVFLNINMISSIDFSNEVEIEEYFRKLFLKIETDYNIDFSGSYDIDVFLDKFYGAVIDIKKNEDYFEYCNVDMNISVSKFNGFVYKVDDFCFDFCNVYFYDGCFYLEPVSIDFYDMGSILEFCEVVYGKKANDVRLFGKVIVFSK